MDELAARWNISIDSVARLVKNGRLAAFRIGRTVRITSSAVEAFERTENRSAETRSNPQQPANRN
jgi:excisionase family DNA binding protein